MSTIRKKAFNFLKKQVMNKVNDNSSSEQNTENNSGVNSERNKHARSIIKNHIVWSMGAGFIPVPIADLVAVSAVQLDMLRQLSGVYGLDFKESQGKAIITTLTGSSIARLGARAVKFIPGIGSMIGGASMSVLSGASTYALGEIFKKHFETGGTFLDFDPKRVKKFYEEKFEKGKQYAVDLREKEKKKSDEAEGEKKDAAVALEELNKLLERKLISQEEYDKLRKRVLENI